jgi:hypothetical protein
MIEKEQLEAKQEILRSTEQAALHRKEKLLRETSQIHIKN